MAERRPERSASPPAASPWARVFAALAPYLLLVVLGGALAGGYYLLLRDSPRLVWDRKLAFLLLALVPPLCTYQFHFRRGRRGAMLHSRSADLRAAARGLTHHLGHLPAVLRVLAIVLIVVALARPERESTDAPDVEGIDIVVALDVSNSMSERDLTPDRISAAKEVLKSFIHRRKSDRVGLVIFGKEAFTQCPLTLDYRALNSLLEDVRLGLIDGRGTAIGNALGTALNRLRKSDAKSKVIILLTDGDNNSGNLSPEQAARYAQSLGVKVFTVLMGRDVDEAEPVAPDLFGRVVRQPTRYPVNPKLLERIAQQTGGTPYLATDTPALEKRFQAILDELDKSRFKEQRGKRDDIFFYFGVPALVLLLLEVILAMTRFRRFP